MCGKLFSVYRQVNTLVFLLSCVLTLESCGAQDTLRLPTPSGDIVTLEIALDQTSRSVGLMFRESLASNKGMIFVFKESQILNFWMKNTALPLSIAFIDTNGIVVHTADMVPYSETIVSSQFPARYAIEVNRGMIDKYKITKGTMLTIPSDLLKKAE